jgi:hypothetical protein
VMAGSAEAERMERFELHSKISSPGLQNFAKKGIL